MTDALEDRIHGFLDRKLQKYPEIEREAERILEEARR